jgi:hypothetical protein
MDATRARIRVAAVLSASLVIPLLASPAAAATCTLSAPATVAIGAQLVIKGSGFPASASVDIAISIDGGSPDEFTVQSDGTGAFEINLTPEAADAGQTTVVATAGSDCTAQVVIAVGVAPATSAPAPTDTGAGEGSEGTPPRTDATAVVEAASGAPASVWLMATLLFFLGLGGLIVTRPARSR